MPSPLFLLISNLHFDSRSEPAAQRGQSENEWNTRTKNSKEKFSSSSLIMKAKLFYMHFGQMEMMMMLMKISSTKKCKKEKIWAKPIIIIMIIINSSSRSSSTTIRGIQSILATYAEGAAATSEISCFIKNNEKKSKRTCLKWCGAAVHTFSYIFIHIILNLLF